MAIRLECALVMTQQKPDHDQNAGDAEKICEQVLHFISSGADLSNSRTLNAAFLRIAFSTNLDVGAVIETR